MFRLLKIKGVSVKITRSQLRKIIAESVKDKQMPDTLLKEDLSSLLTLGLTKAIFILLAHYGLRRSNEKASALRDIADEIEGTKR